MTKRHFTLPPARQSGIKRFPLLAVFSLYCLCWLLAGATQVVPAKHAQAARELALNAPVERELQRGETHTYEITLVAGTYLRLLISPVDIDVQSQLLAPGGSDDIGVSYYPTEKGTRFVSLIADASGSYRLEIRLGETAKPGSYEVKIEERRPASEQDRIRVAAEKAEGEARILVNGSNGVERVRLGISKYEEALTFWRQIGERKGEMRVLTSAALKYREMGEPQTALEYNKLAIQIARGLGDRYQEANLTITFGLLYKSLGENQKALDSFNQARQLSKDLSARYGEAIAVYNIGRTLAALGELPDGLRHLEEALPVFSALGDRFGECNSLNAIGTIHRSLGDNQKGIEFYNRALAVARKGSRTDVEAYSLGNLGNAYLEMGDKPKALDFYEQAVKLSRSLGDMMGEGDGLRMIGDVAYLLGDHQKALDSLTQSLRLFRSIWERDREARTLQSLARVNYSLGNFAEARKQIEMALEIQEDLRGKVISQQLRENIFTSAQSGFVLYIDLLMQSHHENPSAGHDAAALQANERARSRSLLDLLAESHADIREGVPHSLIALSVLCNSKSMPKPRLAPAC